jgi:hypothetical protein
MSSATSWDETGFFLTVVDDRSLAARDLRLLSNRAPLYTLVEVHQSHTAAAQQRKPGLFLAALAPPSQVTSGEAQILQLAERRAKGAV